MPDPQAKPITPNSHLFHSWAADLVLSAGVPESLPGLLLSFFKQLLLEKNEAAVSVGACMSLGHGSSGRGLLGIPSSAQSCLQKRLIQTEGWIPQQSKLLPEILYVVVLPCQLRKLISPWVYWRVCLAVSCVRPCLTSAYPSSPHAPRSAITARWALSHRKVKQKKSTLL